jgi:hypothetical protein
MTWRIDAVGAVFAAVIYLINENRREYENDADKDVFYQGCGCA